MRSYVWSFLCICLALFGCKNRPSENRPVQVALYSHENLEYPVSDREIADSIKNEFVENFFVPWDVSPDNLLIQLDTFPGKEISYLEKYLADDEWYGENKKPHKKAHRQRIVTKADLDAFPNFLRKGIVIAHTDLRRIPTARPGFDTYSKAGEGYPFDYFQETGLWANTPLQILHMARDKQWCYVISPYYKGWVAMHDIALVDQEFITNWKTGRYCLPLSDDLPLTNTSSLYALNAKIGMVLPFEELFDNPKNILAYYVAADENQNAQLLKAEVNITNVAFNSLKFSATNLKPLVAQLTSRAYGWGGYLENRDCSAMIRDLLATYKIWLPRDSNDQIEVGQQYELTGTIEEKIKTIQEKGIPFLTILRKKGHNMLYVGDSPEGEPLIFHAIWGLKTTYTNKDLGVFLNEYPLEGIHQETDGTLKGRYIIGEAVITSVLAGKGNHGITTPLLDEIYAMSTILEN